MKKYLEKIESWSKAISKTILKKESPKGNKRSAKDIKRYINDLKKMAEELGQIAVTITEQAQSNPQKSKQVEENAMALAQVSSKLLWQVDHLQKTLKKIK